MYGTKVYLHNRFKQVNALFLGGKYGNKSDSMKKVEKKKSKSNEFILMES